MHTEITETGRFERTLTIRLDEAELAAAKARAARSLSRSMKIKGFRPGKAPVPMVERMVGSNRLRTEAVEDAVPEAIAGAIEAEELEPATAPAITAIRDGDNGGVEVDVVISLWPTLDAIPDFTGRKVQVEPPVVTPDDVERQIDALRNQFAELQDVSRPAIAGDYVLVDVTARDGAGADIDGAAARDLLYEVGSGSFIRGLDEMLVGAAVGTIAAGEGTLPPGFTEHGGRPVTLRALVKEVKVKRLPDLTDEFVAEVTEFDTTAELRAQLERNLLALKTRTARAAFESRALDELVADIDIELPQGLVEAEAEARIRSLFHRLEHEGIRFEDYLRIVGLDAAGFAESARAQAVTALSTRILLEGIIAIDGLEVSDDEYREAVGALARSSGDSVDEVEAALDASGQKESLMGDILRSKAVERIAAAAQPVDAEGNPVAMSVDLTLIAQGSDEEAGEEALANGEE